MIFYLELFIFLLLNVSLSAESSFLRFTHENDSLGFFVDRYYTSGTKIEYQRAEIFSPISYFSKLLSLGAKKNCFNGACIEQNSYSLSHLIFTPALYKVVDNTPEDRAYAGLAYFTNSNTLYFQNFILNNQISIGNLGTSSQGKLIQEMIHKPLLFYTPRGWSHELKDKTIHHWDFLNIFTFSHNFAIPFGFRLGNWNQNINLGFQARFGQISTKNSFAVHSIQYSETSPYYENEEEEEFYFFVQPKFIYQFKNWSVSQTNQKNFDYRGILDDRTYTEMERYFLFNYGLMQSKRYEENVKNFLVFNILFNGIEGLSRNESRIVLDYLKEEEYNFQNSGVLLGLYSLFRPRDERTYFLTKYLSFKSMMNKLQIPQSEQNTLLAILYLQGEFNRKTPIQSKFRNAQGEFQFGIVYKSKNIFVNFAWSLSSLDFETEKSLPNFHGWGRLQLGIYF